MKIKCKENEKETKKEKNVTTEILCNCVITSDSFITYRKKGELLILTLVKVDLLLTAFWYKMVIITYTLRIIL